MSNTQLKPPNSTKSGKLQIPRNPSIQISPLESSPPQVTRIKLLRKKLSSDLKSHKKLLKHSVGSTQRSQATKENFDSKHSKTLSQTLRRSPKSSQRNPSFTTESRQASSRGKLAEKSKTIQTPKLPRQLFSEMSELKLNSILQKFIQFKENHFSIVNGKYK
jgi:hypothetical protein